MDYADFETQEEALQEKIKAIYRSMTTLEDTLVTLDEEACKAIETLHQLQYNYYGDSNE
jgi:hypothetical protein